MTKSLILRLFSVYLNIVVAKVGFLCSRLAEHRDNVPKLLCELDLVHLQTPRWGISHAGFGRGDCGLCEPNSRRRCWAPSARCWASSACLFLLFFSFASVAQRRFNSFAGVFPVIGVESGSDGADWGTSPFLAIPMLVLGLTLVAISTALGVKDPTEREKHARPQALVRKGALPLVELWNELKLKPEIHK
jgi:hypothetical protein